MSTATQTRPEHIVIFEGKLINNEVWGHELQALKDYANREQFDLEGECQHQFCVPVDWITSKQRYTMCEQILQHRRNRLIEKGYHYHRCFDCGEVSGCLEKPC